MLTGRDLALLAFLHDFNYATTSTLAVAFWGRYASPARERLKLLCDAGLVDKLRPRVARTQGSQEWIYRLTQRGWRVVVDAGQAADGYPYTPSRLTSIAYVEHDVQVAALVVWLAARNAAANDHAAIGVLEAAGFTAMGPRAARIDPRCQPVAGNRSAAATLGPQRLHLGRATAGVLAPDTTLAGVTPKGKTTAVLIEYDRTAKPTKQIARLRRYDHFLTLGWRQGGYANLDLPPLVLYICPSDQHIAPLAQLADRELTAAIEAADGTRTHPGRELLAFTSRPRVLAGDWRMAQLRPLPPELRRERDGTITHDEHLPLDRLFARRAGYALAS
jgi:hypothetical protein